MRPVWIPETSSHIRIVTCSNIGLSEFSVQEKEHESNNKTDKDKNLSRVGSKSESKGKTSWICLVPSNPKFARPIIKDMIEWQEVITKNPLRARLGSSLLYKEVLLPFQPNNLLLQQQESLKMGSLLGYQSDSNSSPKREGTFCCHIWKVQNPKCHKRSPRPKNSPDKSLEKINR